ncbi:STAS domain-containing protein [Mycobacterium conspicuum]|jgi:anti-anti-sigma factor|uniref:Anti-anti-sigma factor n=1 Tax=Mycobacterium conspicuum TaxID=44010 RepID=A0A1X1T5U5_9MYCO|nr:STAS domain-containing protein [Mycobacterium conspicuum]ORV39946.1 anti-anti-sigma factor [Mycobacterium conspicuum]BBZ42383.1 anti-anti-sigma factor [Mycobacterium conspicuum]
MATPLNLTAEVGDDGRTLLTAAGEIDLSNIDAFTDALQAASAGARGPMTVDLSAIKYLDSAGINALFEHAEHVEDLHLIVHPLLIRVLTISGLTKIANVEAGPAKP